MVLYVLCLTRPRYQVSVYRTIGPLVFRELGGALLIILGELYKERVLVSSQPIRFRNLGDRFLDKQFF